MLVNSKTNYFSISSLKVQYMQDPDKGAVGGNVPGRHFSGGGSFGAKKE